MQENTAELSADMAGTRAPLSYGEKYVGITFNPSKDLAVDDVKNRCASVIDGIQKRIESENGNEVTQMNHERMQWFEAAKVKILEAQMLAVKAITFQY